MRLIDVDALWAQMSELYDKRNEEAYMTGDRVVCVTWDDAVVLMKAAPIIEERKHGRWIKADTHNYLFFKNDRVYKCSICGNLLDFEGVNGGRGDANFCPNCGAVMRKGEEE